MTNYYIEQNSKVKLFDTSVERLKNTISFLPDVAKDIEIKHTEKEIVYKNDEFVFKEDILDELLQEAKQAKFEENIQKRDERLRAGVLYKGVMFDSDTDSKVNIMGAVSVLPDDATVGWNSMDNQTVVLTKAELSELGALLVGLTSMIWGEDGLNVQYINAINAASTLEELAAIEIDYTKQESADTNE